MFRKGTGRLLQVVVAVALVVAALARPDGGEVALAGSSPALCPGSVSVGGTGYGLKTTGDWSSETSDASGGEITCRYGPPEASANAVAQVSVESYWAIPRPAGKGTPFCDPSHGPPLTGFQHSATHDIEVFVSTNVDNDAGVRASFLASVEGSGIAARCGGGPTPPPPPPPPIPPAKAGAVFRLGAVKVTKKTPEPVTWLVKMKLLEEGTLNGLVGKRVHVSIEVANARSRRPQCAGIWKNAASQGATTITTSGGSFGAFVDLPRTSKARCARIVAEFDGDSEHTGVRSVVFRKGPVGPDPCEGLMMRRSNAFLPSVLARSLLLTLYGPSATMSQA